MLMSIRTITAIVLILAFGALLAFMALNQSEPSQPIRLASAEDCQVCHPEVYAEWKANWHARAWFDPLVRAPDQSDNFKKKDCIPCHAPRPIFEAGIGAGERVVERQSNRQNGVDCVSCHKLPSGGFAAANRNAKGDCGPRFHPSMITVDLCTPCHNQHNTVDEWRASAKELRGDNCNLCHYPSVTRPGRNGGPPRAGRSHALRSWRSENLDMPALTIRSEIVDREGTRAFKVSLINDKTPHNVPADSRNRALDLVLTYYKAGGQAFAAADGKRDYGQEAGTYRTRFRNPYRSEIGKKNTQIVSGTAAILEKAIPPDAVRARFALLYKLTPFTPDEEGIEIFSKEVNL